RLAHDAQRSPRAHVSGRRENERAPAVELLVEAAHVFDRDRAHALDEPLARVRVERILLVEESLSKTLVRAPARVGLLLAYGRNRLLLQLLKLVFGERGLAQHLRERGDEGGEVPGERARADANGEGVGVELNVGPDLFERA